MEPANMEQPTLTRSEYVDGAVPPKEGPDAPGAPPKAPEGPTKVEADDVPPLVDATDEDDEKSKFIEASIEALLQAAFPDSESESSSDGVVESSLSEIERQSREGNDFIEALMLSDRDTAIMKQKHAERIQAAVTAMANIGLSHIQVDHCALVLARKTPTRRAVEHLSLVTLALSTAFTVAAVATGAILQWVRCH